MLFDEKIEITGVFLDNGFGSDIFPDPSDPKRPDPVPDSQHCLSNPHRWKIFQVFIPKYTPELIYRVRFECSKLARPTYQYSKG